MRTRDAKGEINGKTRERRERSIGKRRGWKKSREKDKRNDREKDRRRGRCD